MMEVESLSCMSSTDPLSQRNPSLDTLAGTERSSSPLDTAPPRETTPTSPEGNSLPALLATQAPSPGQHSSSPPLQPLNLAPPDSQPEPMEEEPFEEEGDASHAMSDPLLSQPSSTECSPPPPAGNPFPEASAGQASSLSYSMPPPFSESPRATLVGSSNSPAGGNGSPQSGMEGGQVKRKARRKQTIEDIVRRINKPDEQYQSDESEEEETMNRSLTIEMGARPADEVDGGTPELEGHIGPSFTSPSSGVGLSGPPPLEPALPLHLSSPPQQQQLQQQSSQEPPQQQQQQNQHHHQPQKQMSHQAEVKREPNYPPNSNGGLPPSIPMASNISESAYSPHAYKHQMNNGWYHHNFPGMSPFLYPPSPMDPGLVRKFMPFDSPLASDVEKDYLKCQYCERTFRRQKNLENHVENTHQGKGTPKRSKNEGNEMYFKCTHCPYTTKHQSNLYVHLRIHTGERPYICGACGVQYSQSHSLKSHIINKHDGIMSYYIKEKRTRSPRGMSYMTTQMIPDSSIFRMPPPLLPPSMPPSGLDMAALPPSIKTSSTDHLPLSLPGHPQFMQSSPSSHLMNGHASPHYGDVPHNRASGALPPLSNGSTLASHAPTLPSFSSSPAMPSHLSNGLLSTSQHPSQPPTPQHSAPPPTSTGYGSAGSGMTSGQAEGSQGCGAIDLSKKSNGREGLLHSAHAMFPGSGMDARKMVLSESCHECSSGMKLRMLRLNVVRMLGILVPTLNFEEKGISADSDSVDELLQDVIESNIQDEDAAE